MATVEWTDARLNDAFERLIAEMREGRTEMREMRTELRGEIHGLRAELRADIRQLWVTMVGGYVAIVAALIATQL